MLPSYTAYPCQEIIARIGADVVTLPCDIEIRVDRDGHPDKLILDDINALRQLGQAITDKIASFDNIFDKDRQSMAK